jgi:hypothetical protein
MLHFAIRDHGSQWPKVVPIIVWAMRESSSETLGIPPYMCVFGRLPRGPLAVLRDNWLGMNDLPTNFDKSVDQ